jgi:hypothetical protein
VVGRILDLRLLPDIFAICRLAADAAIPAWATASSTFSITRTCAELSVVCLQALVPSGIRCEGDWRCLRVAGALHFFQVGILASLVGPLAAAKGSVFAISTFDTDYLLVKQANCAQAMTILQQAGHTIQEAAVDSGK